MHKTDACVGVLPIQSDHGTRPLLCREGLAMKNSVKLDYIDLKIMAVLEKNGRITNSLLAETVGLSPSPCLMRPVRGWV